MSELCPDRGLLSVYVDGELPSPWKEKMEAHIAGCADCSRQLEAYKRNSLAAALSDEAALEAARQRVWQKLEPDVQERPSRPVRRLYPGAGMWRRRIAIPLPLAAAAILLLAALAFITGLRITETAESPGMTFASDAELDMPGIIPASDMEDVLQYLGSRDNGELIILRLPESRSFVNYGEPAMIKAADYSRNVSNRNMMRGRKP